MGGASRPRQRAAEAASGEEEGALRVAKPKVDEIRAWLRGQLEDAGAGAPGRPGRVLLLSGPSGSCKKTAVRVLAAEAGLRVLEWSAPVPTLYGEHRYISDGAPKHGAVDLPYESKLESFLRWMRSLTTRAPLALRPAPEPGAGPGRAPAGAAGGGTVILVDDLPAVNEGNAAGIQSLVDAFTAAHRVSMHPLVLCAATGGGAGGAGRATGFRAAPADGDGRKAVSGAAFRGCLRAIADALGSCDAPCAQVSLNPITKREVARAVASRIEAIGAAAPRDRVDVIVEAAGGDLRQAMLLAEAHCRREPPEEAPAKARATKPGDSPRSSTR